MADHSQLSEGSKSRILFEAFRASVLALDPNIAEEILQQYIAFKAETNVVDVVPQVDRLRILINMHFPDLYDPRKMAIDVTNLGKWGNGDAEVVLANLDDVPYVVGLVRQSLDLQLSSTETPPS